MSIEQEPTFNKMALKAERAVLGGGVGAAIGAVALPAAALFASMSIGSVAGTVAAGLGLHAAGATAYIAPVYAGVVATTAFAGALTGALLPTTGAEDKFNRDLARAKAEKRQAVRAEQNAKVREQLEEMRGVADDQARGYGFEPRPQPGLPMQPGPQGRGANVRDA